MSMRPGRIFQFGKFQVDALARTLRREETIVKLNSRAFDVLLYLVQNPGKLLTRDELLKHVWQDAFVDESSLPQTVSLLRRALEEKPGDNGYIVTLPGRGYQFVSEVQVVALEVDSSGDEHLPPGVPAAVRNDSGGLILQRHSVETSVITTNQAEGQRNSPISSSRPLIRTVAVLLAATVVAVLFVRFRGPRHPEPKRELLERVLTANPHDNGIVGSAISRDGKFLAYNDRAGGLFLLEIDTGETRTLASAPPTLSVSDWFPDGTHLLVTGDGAKSGTWKMSILNGAMRKISNEDGGVISPDGQHISVFNKGGIWSMGIEGEKERLMVPLEASVYTGGIDWSPSGRRFAVVCVKSPQELMIESCSVNGSDCTTILADTRLRGLNGPSDLVWLQDGRVLFSLIELPPNQATNNIWAINVDLNTGRPLGKPERVTNWVGYTAETPFMHSADGRRLTFSKERIQDTVKIAELDRETGKLGPIRRLTNDDWHDFVQSWTPDSKSVLFKSERNHTSTIYMQSVTGTNPQALISGPEGYANPIFSPDGAWLFYSAYAGGKVWDAASSRLMRRPAEGGLPTRVLSGQYSYDCAAPPSKLCVLGEQKGKQIVFAVLDPVSGRGPNLASVQLVSNFYNWSLSPDGKTIALVKNDDSGICIVSLDNGTVKKLELKRWTLFQSSQWSPDGRYIYVVGATPEGWTIFTSDLVGNTKVLVEVPGNQGWLASPKPSPDGHYLAFTERTYEKNVSMLENF